MPRHSRQGLILSALAFGVILMTLGRPTVHAAPEPAIVNPSWSFDFSFQNPSAVSITDEDGNIRWFWYLPYKVVNNTGEDRLFIPEIVIYNDNGEIIQAGKGVPITVFPKVKHLLNNPLLKDSIEVVGKLLKGEDFAKEGVAIWPVSDEDVDAFSVFIGGIHGETQTMKNPRTGEEEVLRRTLMLEFATPGNFRTPQEQPVRLIEQTEVMR